MATHVSATGQFEIVRREDFSDVTYLLEISHPLMAKAAKPGQFVIVMEHELGERIPLTLADFDPDRGTVTLVVQAWGGLLGLTLLVVLVLWVLNELRRNYADRDAKLALGILGENEREYLRDDLKEVAVYGA